MDLFSSMQGIVQELMGCQPEGIQTANKTHLTSALLAGWHAFHIQKHEWEAETSRIKQPGLPFTARRLSLSKMYLLHVISSDK